MGCSRFRRKTVKRIRIPSIMLLALLLPSIAQAQVSVALAPEAKQQFFSISGAPLAGGCLNTYITGTSTPLATYSESTGTFPNANPIILDSGGFATIFLKNATYRFTLTSAGGVNCSTGTFQYTVDGVSAYSIINQSQNIFLAGASSDPSGTAGELAYRTDIPCFRGFSTFWDCFVTLTGTQTLTNKTLASPAFTGAATGLVATAPTLNSPTIVTPTVGGILNQNGPGTYMIATNTGAGTTLGTLTKLNSSGALIAAITDTGGVVGIAVAGAGASGTVTIQQSGSLNCVFDNTTTLGDYIQISPTVAGDCHDAGATYPTSGQVIGRVLLTQGIIATAPINLFGPEIKPALNNPVAAINTTGLAANVASTPILTPVANGFFRFSCYLVVTQAATVSSTLPACNVLWTDGDTNVVQGAQPVTTTTTVNTVGTTNGGVGAIVNTWAFYAKSGVAISYGTVGYLTSGATPMNYALHARLEGPF
jgi:hypothetical protein